MNISPLRWEFQTRQAVFATRDPGTMHTVVEILVFAALLLAAVLMGYAVLRWAGLPDREALALGHVAGPAFAVLPAWWLGSTGLGGWSWVGASTLAVGGVAGAVVLARSKRWADVLAVEAVFGLATAVVLFFRWGRPSITETEKFMDLGILGVLVRCPDFPPPDMWLAGENLPYYYWGGLPWALPLRLSGLTLDYGYNLVVGLVAGATAVSLWCLGSSLLGRWIGGWLAAFFGVLAGTPDGFRQLMIGIHPANLDLWASSRQVPDAITEYPLFSFWLGDLHPHVVSLPLALAAIGLAAALRGPILNLRAVWLVSLLFGMTWAANPWAMPPTFLAVAAMLLVSDGQWHWPDRQGWSRWAAAIAVGVGGWLFFLPFHNAFDPPSRAVKTVFAWTAPGDLLLYAGALLVPAFAAAAIVARGWIHGTGHRKTALVTGAAGLTLLIGVASGRPTTVFLSVGVAVLVAAVLDPEKNELRPAWALAALGLFLFLVPEVVYLEDGYGDQLHRMNTIFKAYFQGGMLLAACLPAFVFKAVSSPGRRGLMIALMLLVSLPHLVGAIVRPWQSSIRGFDGLQWMSDGDHSLVEILRGTPHETTIVEAVGDAYSEYGRLSAASGVPTVLGWENHEMVWRGPEVLQTTRQRKSQVLELYSAADVDEVRRLVHELGVDAVAIGDLERRDFSAESLTAIESAGAEVVCGEGNASLVFFRSSP